MIAVAEGGKKELVYVYTKAPEHRAILCNRVWGGVVEGHMLRMELMTEALAAYEKECVNVDGNEILDRKTVGAGNIIRESQVCVFMSEETMASLFRWLAPKVQEAVAAGRVDPDVAGLKTGGSSNVAD